MILQKSGALQGSNSYKPVVICAMDTAEEERINSRRAKSTKKISDLSNVPLWYGKVDEPQEYCNQKIGENQIEIIKGIERKVYRPAQQLMNNENVENYEDIMYEYGLEDVTTIIGSEQNWYLIYGTGEDGECKIQDLALEGGLNSNKNKDSTESQTSSRLATIEMADAVYRLMIRSAKNGIQIVCNATKDTSLINIKNMLRKGIAEIYDLDGRKIIISNNGQLIYENGDEVSYRNFEEQDYDGEAIQNDDKKSIQMLDIEIRPNLERMIEEKNKTENYLQLNRKSKRLKGMKKEKGIDEARRAMRDDLNR